MPLESRLVDLYRQQVGAAVAADQRRKLEDSTKKRAIVSASNYGEFKALVDACHLKPLAREEMNRQQPRILNPHAAAAAGFDLPAATPAGHSSNSSSSSSNATNMQVRSQSQLRRQWEARGADPDGQCKCVPPFPCPPRPAFRGACTYMRGIKEYTRAIQREQGRGTYGSKL